LTCTKKDDNNSNAVKIISLDLTKISLPIPLTFSPQALALKDYENPEQF
jgi:hypothetical protein